MHFRFFLGNHSEIGRKSLEDVIHALGAQILDLGHTADRSDTAVRPDAINVICEGFTEIESERIVEMCRQGIRIVLVCTESIANNSLNNFQRDDYRSRYEHLLLVAPYVDAIWCLVPGTADRLRDLNRNAVDVELGYSPRRRRDLVARPEYDFGFFGSVTPYRGTTMQEFGRRGLRVFVMRNFAPPDERDRAIANCKAVLHIKATKNWKIVSSSRCSTALHIGRPVVSQPVASRSIWKQIVRFSKSHDAFYDDAVRVMRDWRTHWERQIDAYQRLLSAEKCLGPAVDALLGSSRALKTVSHNPP